MALKEKLLRHSVYFPHVTTINGWQTEIGITNTIEGLDVHGRLQGYDADGAIVGEAVDITLASLARMEINVASFFARPEDIAYIRLTADSFYLSAYTKFFRKGNRVALSAATGKSRGTFLKLDQQGWTGIAFVNPGNGTIKVTMTAINDSGETIASQTVSVSAGAKVVDTARNLFDADIQSATYIRYQADGDIVGFALNASFDGLMLDGLPAVAERMN